MTLKIQRTLLPTSDPGPAHLSVCLLWGVEVLLAALARMASGDSEGLHGVGETSRVSAEGSTRGGGPGTTKINPVPVRAPAEHRQGPQPGTMKV